MSNLERLSQDQLRSIHELHKQEKDRRVRDRPADFFPWHAIQQWVLDAPGKVDGETRIILVAGGNRGGKSKVAMGIASQMIRRTSPLNAQLLTTDRYSGEIVVKGPRDPLTIWVVPPTLEKARNDWITPQDQMGLRYWVGSSFVEIKHTPDLIIYCQPPGISDEEMYDVKGVPDLDKCDKILIKSQDQKLETFESSEVDLVIFDEEVLDQRIWNSCRMRIGTTHGVIVMPYTPLHGLSWSYKSYWKPYIKDGLATKMRDRCWIYNPTKAGEEGEANLIFAQMGSADNPRARSYAKEIEHDRGMSEAEKAARLYGEYGFVEGAFFPALAGIDVLSPLAEHKPFVVDHLPGQRVKGSDVLIGGQIRQWLLVSDPNKSYGAVLSALDGDGNLYFVAEHLEVALPDSLHAEAFKEMERSFATGPVLRFADPGSAGAQSIVNMEALGVFFSTLPKGAGSVSASVKKLRGMTYVDPKHKHPITGEYGAPRVYFYRPGLLKGGKFESELASQLSLARQSSNETAPPDTPHKDIRNRMDLFDCARYTAVIAGDLPPVTDLPKNAPGVREDNRMPSIPLEEEALSLWDMEIALPEYDFSQYGG